MEKNFKTGKDHAENHLELTFVNPKYKEDSESTLGFSSLSSDAFDSNESDKGEETPGTYNADASDEQSDTNESLEFAIEQIQNKHIILNFQSNVQMSRKEANVQFERSIKSQGNAYFEHGASAENTAGILKYDMDSVSETESTCKEAHYQDFYDYRKYADIPIRYTASTYPDFGHQLTYDMSLTNGMSQSCDSRSIPKSFGGSFGVKISPIRSLQHPKYKAGEKKPMFEKPAELSAISKSFDKVGFGKYSDEDWEYIRHPDKVLAHESILNMVREATNPDVKVYIGKLTKLKCHSIILKAYSDLCKELPDLGELHLSEQIVSPRAFINIYEWMINDVAHFEFDGIIEFYEAATYLRIPMLVKQIWEYLDDCLRFSEERACFTYLAARERNIDIVAEIMLRRVNKFFIVFASTLEFLSIGIKDLCQLLSSSQLSVNTEIEVFMVAVYWLNYYWPARKEHAVDAMRCIRFSTMPTLYIVNLHTKSKLCPEVERAINNPEVEQLIYGGFMMGHIDKSETKPIGDCASVSSVMPLTRFDERKWTFDKNCDYHHTHGCINKHLLTYASFEKHLLKVSTSGARYYNSMDLLPADTVGLRCCDGPKLK